MPLTLIQANAEIQNVLRDLSEFVQYHPGDDYVSRRIREVKPKAPFPDLSAATAILLHRKKWAQ